MPWDNDSASKKSISLKLGKILLGTALLIGTSGAAIAQNMVVRSVGPSAKSYPAGKKISGGTKVVLKRLDKVTLLGKGGTRVLKGPGTFTIGGRTRTRTGASTRLSSFINSSGRGRARTGAYRSAGDNAQIEPKNPSLWHLDVNQGGKFCVIDPGRLVLWRPDYTGSASASIVEPVNGTITKVAWSKGSALKAWPVTVAPITNGSKYQLIGSNLPKTAEVDFVVLPSSPKTPDDAATMLIENECESQLELLVDKLETDSSASEG